MFIVRIDYFTQSADLQKPFWFVMLRCSIYKVQSPLALASSFISLPHSISFVKYFFFFFLFFSWLPISLCDCHSREQLCQYIMSGSVCQELFSTFFKIFLSKPLFRTRSLERSISILYLFRFVNPFFQFFRFFIEKADPYPGPAFLLSIKLSCYVRLFTP